MRTPRTIDWIAGRRVPPAGVLVLLVAVALLAWQGWLAWGESQRLAAERAAVGALSRRAPAAPAMSEADRRRHAQIDALARHLATPWDEWLSLLERRDRRDAVLQRLAQDASTGEMQITAQAPTAAAMMNYVVALERDGRLGGVLLNRHELMTDQPGAPVQFDLVARWRSVPAAIAQVAQTTGEAAR